MTLHEIAAEIEFLIERLTVARTHLASLHATPELSLTLAGMATSATNRRGPGRPRKLQPVAPQPVAPVETLTQPPPPPVEELSPAAPPRHRGPGRPRKVQSVAAQPVASVEAPTQPPPPAVEKLSPAAPPRHRVRRRATEPTALSGKVPDRPVAVPAAEVRRKLPHVAEPAAAQAPPASGHSLDDLVRELRHRQPSELALEA